MAGGQDDTSCSFLAGDCQLGRRRGCQTDIDDVVPHTHEGTAYDLLYHVSAEPRIASHNDFVIVRHCSTPLCGIGSGETDNIYRVQTLSDSSADRTADTGNTFNQTHIIALL